MPNNNTQATIVLILYIATLGSSCKLFLSDGEGTFQNSTRIKRQDIDSGKSCTLPDHPPNGKYKLTGSWQYTPGYIANEYSSIQLACADEYVAKSANPQTLCIEGLWSPPLSGIGECVGTASNTISSTTSATKTRSSSSSSENSCFLPSHPANGVFSIAGSTKPYVPSATTSEFSSIRLSCLDAYKTQTINPQSLCIEGAWSPPILNLGECIRTAQSNISSQSGTSSGEDCFLPRHPSNGEFRIIGSQNRIYTPDSSVPQLSSIDLTCKFSHVIENNLARAMCYKGEWFPPVSKLGGCVRKDALTTTTTQAPHVKSSCSLPDHPINGRFKILGEEPYAYKPYSPVHEFATLQLQCTGEDEPKSKNAFCFAGEWTPALINLGECTEYRTPSPNRRSRDGCTLPSNHLHGVYEKSSDKKFDVIYLLCNPGYYPRHQSHLCSNGTWYPELFECIRTCPPVKKSETYTATCVRGSSVINCNEPLEGTEVHVTCNVFFEYTVIRSIPKCEGGAWSRSASPCVPECGKSRVPAKELVIGGQYSNKGEYPWLVGIYFANESHICGGSIISRYFVLSAAHCFTTYNNTIRALNPIDITQYLVAAGKHYRSLYDKRDVYKQITGLKRIYIPKYYYGIVQNYRYDYAILAVKLPFTLSEYVQLVCIDWESKYETQDFKENNTAVVSGWGYTMQASSPSEELKKLQVHFKWRPSCDEFLPDEFSQRYFTEDKICAGFLGQNVCQGDSGGGLYFEHNHVYYVRGIVSLSPNSQVGCSLEHYALYTNVSTYLEIIKSETGLNL